MSDMENDHYGDHHEEIFHDSFCGIYGQEYAEKELKDMIEIASRPQTVDQ